MQILLIAWGVFATLITTTLFFITDLPLLACYVLGGLCSGAVFITTAGVFRYLDRQNRQKSPCDTGRRK